MDSIAKVEYNVRSLTTRAVTLFPSRAQVSRDIKDVPLRPGLNEITIYGLTPTVDEHSIKVEGSGHAIISDIAVESLPNRDIFEDIYPDSDEDKSDDDEDGDADQGEEEPEFPESHELKEARQRSEELQKRVNQIADAHASTEAQHGILNDYAKTLKGGDGIDIEDFLGSYKRAADRLRTDWFEASAEKAELRAELEAAQKETDRLLRRHRAEKKEASRAWRKATLARTKARIQEARREEERIKEKERVREEREKFWPKHCYAVRIQLTTNAVVHTPLSSRRGSISSDTELVTSPAELETEAAATTTCNLVLSYVTSSAFWTPSYDLQLSTATGTGTLCFDAQLNNTTSETWSKCKITLSTSQVSSSSLEEKIPALVPWHLTTTSSNNANNMKNAAQGVSQDSILQSREERGHSQTQWRQQQQGLASKGARKNLFGVDQPAPHKLQDYQMQLMLLEQQNKKRLVLARQEQDAQQQQQQQQQSFGNAIPLPPPPPQTMPAPAIMAPGQGQQQMRLMLQQQQQQQQQQRNVPVSGGLFGGSSSSSNSHQRSSANNNNTSAFVVGSQGGDAQPATGDMLNDFDFDSFLVEGENNEAFDFNGAFGFDFEDSFVDESGFTTTYELPGQKTLAPRSSSSKQRVARINLAKIAFSHTVIAKYKPAAYLSAKIVNGSKLTLLKGPVGVTLDGSFMGRTSLPRCSSGEPINLGLGADPTIRVTYPRPEAKRATTGFFTKEDIKIFERCIKLENTKPVGPASAPNKAVKILVLDQIPVADTEKVRIELLKPEGLSVDGPWKEAGVVGREKDDKDREGANAMAGLKKKGEINWTVSLKPGRAMRLPLEYLVAVPIGEMAIQS